MIAEVAERCYRQRMGDLPGPSLSGVGWYAVRTEANSNDLNGVISDGAVPDADRERLLSWLGDVPASWHTSRADAALTDALLAAGATSERTGHWCGRVIGEIAGVSGTGTVARAEDPAMWSSVFEACGWYDDDLEVRRTLQEQAFASDHWAHWWVLRDGVAVAALGAWCGDVLEIVDVAVLPDHRRRGFGTALVGAAMGWGRERGLTTVVAAPSPEGAELFGSLGFGFEPVTPDVCFYLAGVRPA